MTYMMMRTPSGYRVGRLENGQVRYAAGPDGQPWSSPKRQAARRRCEKLNVGELPSSMTEDELAGFIGSAYVGTNMRVALRSLLVGKSTWKVAATCGGVTESGLLRCLRRLSSIKASSQG